MNGAEEELFTVARVARELGVGRPEVEDFVNGRAVAGVDYVSSSAGAVFTEAGREKILKAFVLQKPPPRGPDRNGAVSAIVREDLRVTRTGLWEKRVLASRENDQEVVVSVKTTRFLRAGMLLRGCIQEPGNAWSYQGRLPHCLGEMQLFMGRAE